MKYLYLIALTTYCLCTNNLFSQVGIGTSTVNNKAILEFGSENKGIILPWVTSAAAVVSPSGGMLIFDSDDKKVKYFNDNTNTWIDMSITSGAVDTSIQDSFAEQTSNSKTIIGSPTTTKTGVLVLESSEKALMLPKVADVTVNFPNPEPGTMVYDTFRKKIAVYNGLVWSFWGE
ncbi:hypothetical protein [Flavobacterium sp.]|jgi:hypothetical protein|uniref:hypothetical protein n=1 Tax=Flavobacterium sp. TaxID=239 RepID=UPI0037BEF78A